MPIPFDRFRYLNGTEPKPFRVNNFSGSHSAEVQVDEGPIEVLPPNGEMEIPAGAQEIGIRRQDEAAPPIEVAFILMC